MGLQIMALSEIFDHVRGLDRESYQAFAQQGNEPTVADVEAFEAECGFRLPMEFRAFAVHPLGGLYLQVSEALWPPAKANDVGPFWSFLNGFFLYSLSTAAPDWIALRTARAEMKEAGHNLVPFLKVLGDPDPYCFTAEGRMVIWRHETPDEPEPVEGTFSEVVMKEVRALEERKERKLRGEDRQ